jgi:hypothetical protein
VRDRGEVVVVIYPRERRGEQSRAKESLEFFFGKKFLRGKRRSKEAKQRKARRSKIEGF